MDRVHVEILFRCLTTHRQIDTAGKEPPAAFSTRHAIVLPVERRVLACGANSGAPYIAPIAGVPRRPWDWPSRGSACKRSRSESERNSHVKLSIKAVAAMAAILIATTLSQAQAQPVATKDPKAVKAGTYAVEPYHTQVVFSISHFGFSDFSGAFSGASGTLELDPAKISTAKLEVTIPVQTVLTTVPPLTDQLKGDGWFEASKFPNAEFKSTKVTATGKDSATIAGDLTLHGVTKPVTLRAHLVGSGTNPLDKSFSVGFEANGTIKRSDFDIKQYLPLLGDDVELSIAGAFTLQQ